MKRALRPDTVYPRFVNAEKAYTRTDHEVSYVTIERLSILFFFEQRHDLRTRDFRHYICLLCSRDKAPREHYSFYKKC
jgi:hypothetical protein